MLSNFFKYWISTPNIVSEWDDIAKGNISPINGTLGYVSWIFVIIVLREDISGPIQ